MSNKEAWRLIAQLKVQKSEYKNVMYVVFGTLKQTFKKLNMPV